MQFVVGVQFKRLIINTLAYQKRFCLVIGLLEEEFVFLFFLKLAHVCPPILNIEPPSPLEGF